MINEILNTTTPESCINIIYDLYRIFHKAGEGVYVQSFVDSHLTIEEREILQRILSDTNLENRLGDIPYLNTLFAELEFFEERILTWKLQIDEKNEGKNRKKLFGLSNYGNSRPKKITFSLLQFAAILIICLGLTGLSLFLIDKSVRSNSEKPYVSSEKDIDSTKDLVVSKNANNLRTSEKNSPLTLPTDNDTDYNIESEDDSEVEDATEPYIENIEGSSKLRARMYELLHDSTYIRENGIVKRAKLARRLNLEGFRKADGTKFRRRDIPKFKNYAQQEHYRKPGWRE